MEILRIFVTSIGPVIAIAGVGYLLALVKGIDPKPLNTADVYVLMPALVFHSLAVAELEAVVNTLFAQQAAMTLGLGPRVICLDFVDIADDEIFQEST